MSRDVSDNLVSSTTSAAFALREQGCFSPVRGCTFIVTVRSA